ncbi:hypothetical protein OG599_12140 [Streptomyces sp. NBC_01335]|uniref:hypothetical protein n=1 Tax=Streptomyces sp. NBC_01335 TaxID=2903828 RepID=UPI002E12282D|nr:hypothetical protein OG599_12140 [Streptomyces sp. NBC_01335]
MPARTAFRRPHRCPEIAAAALLALLVTLLLPGTGGAKAGTVAGTNERADRKAGAPARAIQEGA